MDDVTFRAGIWLLGSDDVKELRDLMNSINDPEMRHTRASAFIRDRVDPVELVRAAAEIRAGLLNFEPPEFARERGSRNGGT